MTNKALFKRICLVFVLLFLLIYAGRVAYEYRNEGKAPQMEVVGSASRDEGVKVKNYATLKMDYAEAPGVTQVLDQKYEKVATISSDTSGYQEDENRLYAAIEQNRCVIQKENKRGLPGNRRVEVVIGVKPERFDEAVRSMEGIGRVVSKTVTKTDKTAEYKQMLADRATLEKTKESYVMLRQKGGSITELMTLEQKIIEIEGQIQRQQVSLGEYSDENAFCTINLTLQERTGSSGMGRTAAILWSALVWSAGVYAAVLAIIILTGLAAVVVVSVLKFSRSALVGFFNSPGTGPDTPDAETAGDGEAERNGA
ncbi:MAG: DUF4349 domain-containing protein [Firmicutes bacterium]|nr:DUF4349 domain-containing protein [Bacillota bacterium]